MSNKLPRKALIAVSSFNGAIYPGGHKTGVFFVEALHPFEVLTASAGHSALYDYPKAKGLQAIAADVWDRGGIVGTVCHGPAILPGIIDSKTGNSIIHGKTVTGFTMEGELIFRILDKLRADGVVPVVEAVTAAGAFYSGSVGAFDDYSITSGRVVTGTNPASGRSAAERGVKLFDNLEIP
jgi:putative intracellular protease/amidase